MRKIFVIAIFTLMIQFVAIDSYSQCSMCRRVAETGHANDSGAGRGLNKGILYLLSIPYLLGGIGIFAWYKNKKK